MKLKRYKRAQKILSFYRYNYSYQPPYRVLLDGTFCMAALQNKISLSEQMPKYFCEEVTMCTTRCVLEELVKLGSKLYGAFVICKQFEVERCSHEPSLPASECLLHIASRMKTCSKFFIATQDRALTDSLRKIPGVPILFIKYNGILIDKPSSATNEECMKTRTDVDKIIEMKKQLLENVEPVKRKKRKGPKGPNPLSIKKKKKVVSSGMSVTSTKTASGKRRRKKKAVVCTPSSAQ
ncbi:hypothetical protein AB6A40_011012 [Gnathostoma spinigerum]|uniref:rRNA-processing protein UTP23 homolog n=1 Tax=Gnathostoma spinigerum TaxID=75299 RepID=A0ABD6EX00_9BILA